MSDTLTMLGKLAPPEAQRDAVHVAVVPVERSSAGIMVIHWLTYRLVTPPAHAKVWVRSAVKQANVKGTMDAVDKQNVVAMTEASHWPTPANLADAASELEEERGERALAWQAAKEAVKEAHKALKQALSSGDSLTFYHASYGLVNALDELEKLEDAQ